MRRRLYFLLPDVKLARRVFKELLLERVEERHIHFLAREGTELGDLPEATLLQKSDALHGLSVGLIAGGLTGAVAGVIVLMFPPEGLTTGLGVVLVTSLLGAIVGIWASGIIASSVPNTHLKKFEKDIRRGKVLMMLDVPKDRMGDITDSIHRHHPRTVVMGRDPTIPAFP
jgi:hypothetical protein